MKKILLLVIFFTFNFALLPSRVIAPNSEDLIFISVTDSIIEGGFGFVRATSISPIEDTLKVVLSFNKEDTFNLFSGIDKYNWIRKIPSPIGFDSSFFQVEVFSHKISTIFNVKIVKKTWQQVDWSKKRLKYQTAKLDSAQKVDSVKILLNSFKPDVKAFLGNLGVPMEIELFVTDEFGVKRKTNESTRIHKGVDYRAPIGTPVFATQKGKVVIARYSPHFGNTIMIKHGGDVETTYLHLSEFAVSEGDSVELGCLIGYSGATGNVTGAHLHYGTRLCKIPISPDSFKSTSN